MIVNVIGLFLFSGRLSGVNFLVLFLIQNRLDPDTKVSGLVSVSLLTLKILDSLRCRTFATLEKLVSGVGVEFIIKIE